MFTFKSAVKRRFLVAASVLTLLTLVLFAQPCTAHASPIAGLTAKKLAETGDIVSVIALVTGILAVVALIITIVSKKVKSNKKQEWKYPF